MKYSKLRPLALALISAALLLPGSAIAATPGATTGQATSVTDTTATLNGVVNPNKEATNYQFQYGRTITYGSATPKVSAGSKGHSAVSAPITGLKPSTVYHFRLEADNPSGTVTAQDATFTTTATGAAQPGANGVTITASPAAVTFGRATVLAGTVSGNRNGGVKVTLEQSAFPFTTGFKALAVATTDANGAYSFAALLPMLNTRYEAVAKTKPPGTSAAVQVNVRLAVTRRVSASVVGAGQRVRFSGLVKPAHVGKLVRIQRRSRTGGWKTVSKTLTRASTSGQSKYSKKVRITTGGVYRVRVYPADGDHTAGTSSKKRIRIGG